MLAGGGCTFNISDNPNASGAAPWYEFHSQSQVGQYSAEINQVAGASGVDSNLIRSVMYVETTHGWYDAPAAALGLNKSILPMNINVDYWGSAFGTRADLAVPLNNIGAGARILGGIQANLPPGASIAKVATLYNNLGATTVSNYGARVETVYRLQPWR